MLFRSTEASLIQGVHILGASTLVEALEILCGQKSPRIIPRAGKPSPAAGHNFSSVKGQDGAKRALEVAAAGGHSVMMSGPPGSGKTMLARCVPTILPPLENEESLETTKIYSAAGLLQEGPSLVSIPPFRSPHHTVSPDTIKEERIQSYQYI